MLRLVGAGFPRTGTSSLKVALERLLGEPCYHMSEFFDRPEHALTWAAALRGESVDWTDFTQGYAATVDTPACLFWRELAEAFPDAPVLLSRRSDPQEWLTSMRPTVLHQLRTRGGQGAGGEPPAWLADVDPALRPAVGETFGRLGRALLGDPDDDDQVVAAYEAHLELVRSLVPADRLVQWQPGDGWEPLCEALGVPVPDEPFPHRNSRQEFIARVENGSDGQQS